MSEPLAALVVGCGQIGSEYDRASPPGSAPRTHAGAYAASHRTMLSGGVDPDPGARARFTELWGAPCFATIEAALATCEPELVSICTPPESRLAVVDALADAPIRAVWAEKPLADGLEPGGVFVDAWRQRRIPVQVNFLRRFDPLHRRVAQAVAGRVLHADFRFSGTLENYGSHAFDLFRWFVGDPVVVAAVDPGVSEPLVELRTEDGRRGTFARIEQSALPLFDCDLWLAESRYTLAALGEQLLVAERGNNPGPAQRELLRFASPEPQLGLEHAMECGLLALLDHLDRGVPLACSGDDGVAELRIREAALRAAELGAPVALEWPSGTVKP